MRDDRRAESRHDEDRHDEDREPDATRAPGARRWADYLDWVREELIRGVLSLPEAEQRRSRVPSGWSPIELLSHVLHMEQRWFLRGFLGERTSDPWGDWNVEEPWRPEVAATARWVVADHVRAEDLAARLRAVGERTATILREVPLDTPGSSGGHFDGEPPTLEWICFHVLTEYARHAGHLDIVVELSRPSRAAPG